MTKYEYLYESIQDQLDNGFISQETAEYLNDVAYEMYADEEYDGNDEEFTEAMSNLAYKRSVEKQQANQREAKAQRLEFLKNMGKKNMLMLVRSWVMQ